MINKVKKVKKIEPIHEKVMLELRPKKKCVPMQGSAQIP